MSHSKNVKLGEVVSFHTGKLNSNAETPNGAYPFFTCSQETLRTDTFSFDTEAVLLAGNNANGIYPLKFFRGRFDAYQRTYIVRSRDEERLINRFLFYALQPKLSLLKSISTGAATKFLTLTILNDVELWLPHVATQRKIAAVLGTYDDLIENNRRRIEILEEIARRLYREWFVKFRFPGHAHVPLTDSPLGKIPNGWRWSILGEVLRELESGSRPKGGIDPKERGVPSIGAENINGLGKYDYSKERYVTRAFFEGMRRGVVKSGDVLLYKDGAHIGRKSLFRDGYPHLECSINEHVFILRSNDTISQAYLFLWLNQEHMTQAIRNLNANAAQPGINQVGVKGLSILVPNRETLSRFDAVVEPMLAELFNLAKRISILQTTRDLLLPRLISGELEVSELPIAVEEAARDGE